MSKRFALPAGLLVLALVTAACGSTGASPGASSSPTASPTPDGLVHPTGRTEIVLRFDEAGGFVPVEFFASHVPYFTLYGDGTVVFVSSDVIETPAGGGPVVNARLRTGKLSEDQIQALLEFALGEGGLAAARTEYQNPLVADAPTAVFEINAANDSKTVSVVALSLDAEPGPDSAIKAAFVKLADRLRNFDQGGALASAVYEPAAYRGVLFEAGGIQGVPVRPWPWTTLTPQGFVAPEDPNALQQRKRVLSPDEASELGVEGFEGGIQAGVFLSGPDGVLYSFVLRPLLPDETE